MILMKKKRKNYQLITILIKQKLILFMIEN